MSGFEPETLDETGKVVLDGIYDQPDPRPYFSNIGRLDYIIPELAKPVFRQIISAYRNARDTSDLKLVDIGCSYGINAALLKHDLDMPALYQRYDADDTASLARSALVARDRELFEGGSGDEALEIVGVDVAANAIRYALDAHILDDAVIADLETDTPLPAQRESLADADIVLSTGCLGYVTEKTLEQVLTSNGDRRPWMAHFVLRMFPFDPIREMLTRYGYVTGAAERTFRQRRFASAKEQREVVARLNALGIDPSGKENTGWYHTNFYLSRPAEDISVRSVDDLALV